MTKIEELLKDAHVVVRDEFNVLRRERDQLRAKNARLKKDVAFYMDECDEIAKAKVDLQNDLALWQAQGQSNYLVDEHRAFREENARLKEEVQHAWNRFFGVQEERDTIAVRALKDHGEAETLLEECEQTIAQAVSGLGEEPDESYWVGWSTAVELRARLAKLRARKEGKG